VVKYSLKIYARYSVFAVEIATVKDYKFAVAAVKGKVRVLAAGMRLSDHRGAALWAKHSGPPS